MAKYSNRAISSRRQSGFVLTTELVLLVTVMVIGTVVGWVAIRDATVSEMYEFAESIKTPGSGYAFSGLPSSAVSDSSGSSPVGQSFTFDYMTPNAEGGMNFLPGAAPVDTDNSLGVTADSVPQGYVAVFVDGVEVLVPVTAPDSGGDTGLLP